MSSKGSSSGAYNGPCATVTIIAAQYTIPLGGAAAYGAATQGAGAMQGAAKGDFGAMQGAAKGDLGAILMAYAGAMANAYQGSTATSQQAEYAPTTTSATNTFTIGNPQTQTYTATNSMAATNSIADVVANQATEQAYEPATIDAKAGKISKQIGEARKEAKAEQPLVAETTTPKFDEAKADEFTYQQDAYKKSEDAYGIKTAEQKDAYGVTPKTKNQKTKTDYQGTTPEVQAAQKELAKPDTYEAAKEIAYEKTEPKQLGAPTTNTQLPKSLTTINRDMPANYEDTYNISPQSLYKAAKNPHYDTLPNYNPPASQTINQTRQGMFSPDGGSEIMIRTKEEDRRRKLRAMIAHAN